MRASIALLCFADDVLTYSLNYIFIFSDITSLVVQAIGGGIAATANTTSGTQNGSKFVPALIRSSKHPS